MIDLSHYKKILIVADVHADSVFLKKVLKTARDNDCDAVIQLGDFGWWPTEYPEFPKASHLTPIYFVDGNHEEHTKLNQDNEITELIPGIFHMSRGTHLKIGNMDCLSMGGAYSIDRRYREEGRSWFIEEMITDEQVDKCRAHIEHAPFDLVFSHDCPLSVNVTAMVYPNAMPPREQLDRVREMLNPRFWFFGHYHMYTRKWTGSVEMYGLPSNIDGYIQTVVFDCINGVVEKEVIVEHTISSPMF